METRFTLMRDRPVGCAGRATISTTAVRIGLSGSSFTLTDLWTGGTSTTTGQISASVAAHGVAAFRVPDGSPLTSATSRLRGVGSNRCIDVDDANTASGAALLACPRCPQ